MSRRLSPSDPEYPLALGALDPWPGPSPADRAVHVKGRLPRETGVCVVGTRAPRGSAVAFTERLAAALAEAGYAVLSGGARGIDAAAHRGALAAGGTTLAVLPGSLAHPYPERHRTLFRLIEAGGGGLLSLDAAAPVLRPFHFHRRNAVMAALAVATVVVEAPHKKSGTMSTVRASERLERPRFVVPFPPWDEAAEGNQYALSRGATPLTSLEVLLDALPPARRDLTAEDEDDVLGADARALAAVLARSHVARHRDALCLELGWAPGRLAAAGLELELAGWAREQEGFLSRW
ncbi:MAG: DNA-processing protein DprA [Myxococcota bacterium]